MTIDIARFILYVVMIVLIWYYLYIAVIEILIHNKFIYGKHFPKEEDYRDFVVRNSLKCDGNDKR
ncbi:hypothetical protein PDN14_26895 [Bacillus cereus group sp. Bc222]|uniref:hypothetical protein n=1 Tax=unclassified Bacillus cereus group TaxID=2750818 RepID=UPI001F574D4B|nr:MULTISPECIES: hypothetical protein [unclassified Bacillus cereus group]MDA2242002.1 hypothetical protein [Bacillus cereus group sp. Bc222]